jgi:hypothetical protein
LPLGAVVRADSVDEPRRTAHGVGSVAYRPTRRKGDEG